MEVEGIEILRVAKWICLWGPALAASICFASIAAGGSDAAVARAVVAQTPLLGAVTDTSAVLVVRTSKPATVVVHYGTGVLDSATAPVVTKSTHDNAAHIALEGLLPETTYSYAVEINTVLDPSIFSFTTFPAQTDERSFTFVAFADQDTPRPAPAYAAGASENPAFVIQLGDFTHLAVGPNDSEADSQGLVAAQSQLHRLLPRRPVVLERDCRIVPVRPHLGRPRLRRRRPDLQVSLRRDAGVQG